MMRRLVAALLVAALGLSVLGLAGCKDYTEDFNKYIAQVNDHVSKFQSMETSIQNAATSLNTITLNVPGAKRALGVTKAIRVELKKEQAELAAAVAIMNKIKALDVKDEMKKYADLEIAWLKAQNDVVDAEIELFEQMDVTYKAVRDKTGTTKQITQSQAKIDEITAKIQTLTEKAAAAQKAAADYFDKNVVGG
jgi:DNA repair exonuclease SbcCD ATPase subunit